MHYSSVRGPAADLVRFFAELRARRPDDWIEEDVPARILKAIRVAPSEHLLVRSPWIGSRSFRLTFVLTDLELALVSIIPVEERYTRELSGEEAQAVVQSWLSTWASPVLKSMPTLSLH